MSRLSGLLWRLGLWSAPDYDADRERVKRAVDGMMRAPLRWEPPAVITPDPHVARLTLLAEGCKRHPAYRAIKRPRTDCSRCNDMWAARKAMNGGAS